MGTTGKGIANRILAAALCVGAVACGGVEGDEAWSGEAAWGDEYAASEDAILGGSAPASVTAVVVVPGSNTVSGAPSVQGSSSALSAVTAALLIQADSPPDPIPARNAFEAPEGVADCQRVEDQVLRERCFRVLAQRRETR